MCGCNSVQACASMIYHDCEIIGRRCRDAAWQPCGSFVRCCASCTGDKCGSGLAKSGMRSLACGARALFCATHHLWRYVLQL